jgi:hypothetical protein
VIQRSFMNTNADANTGENLQVTTTCWPAFRSFSGCAIIASCLSGVPGLMLSPVSVGLLSASECQLGVGVGVGAALTVTTIESLVESALSFALKLNVYVPDAEKVATVTGELASANVTVPGPLTLLHV